MNARAEVIFVHEIFQLCLECLFLVERLAHEHEMAARVFRNPTRGEAEKKVLPLPRREASDDARERFGLGQPQQPVQRARFGAGVAGERDAVVDRAHFRRGQTLIE